jgi:magnesium chelatase family protein
VLIATMKPCPCGVYGDPQRTCSCAATAVRQMALSPRAYHRVIKLARTIADLADAEQIGTAHIAEAPQYRPRVAEG